MQQIETTAAGSGGELPFWRQFRWNLIAVFIGLALVPFLAIEVLTLAQTASEAQRQAFNQLESVSQLKQNQIRRWLNDSRGALSLLATGPAGAALTELAANPADEALRLQANAALRGLVDLPRGADEGNLRFQQLVLYLPSGEVVAASADSEIGKVLTQQPFFTASLAGDVLQPPFYRVGTGELTMVAARRLAGPSGAPAAVLAGYLDLDVLSDLMLERNGLGASGETYLVSLESNYLLTPSRFEGYPLTRAYRSEGIDRALGGADGEGSYANYRQPAATVLGVYRWMPELQAGLLSEIESAEALSGQRRARDLSVGLGALTLLFAVTLGLWQAARIARPILAMNAGAARVAAGDLSQPVVVRRRNELGALAKSFNHMTEQLRQTQEGLEQRVSERTAELAQSLAQRERLLLDLRDSLAAREQLSATIRALSSPVLPLLEGLVVMPLVGEIDAARAEALVESLLHAIESQRAKMAIIDVTGVPLVDTHIAAALLQAARAARLLGAQPILAGVRPELAETIVSLGLDLAELQSYPDLRGAVSYALARGRWAQKPLR